MSQNPNQFQQAPIPGQLDLQVAAEGLLSGQLAASVSGSLVAGTPVKLDSTNTGPVPKFVLADDDDAVVFHIIYQDKQASFAAGDPVTVAGLAGPVIWGVADDAIVPGETLEQANTTFKYAPINTHKARGIALDPAAADGDLFRLILMPPAALAS